MFYHYQTFAVNLIIWRKKFHFTFEIHGDLSICAVPNHIYDICPEITTLNHLGLMWLHGSAVCQPHCLWILCYACLYSFLSVLLHPYHSACGLVLISCRLSSTFAARWVCIYGVCWQFLGHNRDKLALPAGTKPRPAWLVQLATWAVLVSQSNQDAK